MIEGLSIIGETINDSVPSTKALFSANDLSGLKALARKQDEEGGVYIDVNVGARSPGFMADMIREIQSVTAKPLSIDTPDPEIAAAGLEAYDMERAGGKRPILNSISAMRAEMFELGRICPFMPLLLVSEKMDESGAGGPCRTTDETVQAARDLIKMAREKGVDISNEHCIIDPGIAPIGSDMEGITQRVLESIDRIHKDPDLAGVHFSVGLSNFTVMLPSKRANGKAVKGPLQNAFLTKAVPLGLDMIIGSTSRKYRLLKPDNDALVCLEECLNLGGMESVMRVQQFYS